MASTTTFKTLIEDVTETTEMGVALSGVTGTATTLTLARAQTKGPTHSQKFPRGCPILVTDPSTATTGTSTAADSTTLTDSGASWTTDQFTNSIITLTAAGISARVVSNTGTVITVAAWNPAGDPGTTLAYSIAPEVNTLVDTYTPSTGAFTVEPDITTGALSCCIITKPNEIGHFDVVKDAINRALKRMGRWMKVPLTYVPDGDMLGGTVTDWWTASAGTASYQNPAHPEVVGHRVVQISHSSTATLTSNTIPCRAAETWYFETSIRATTDGDTAALVIRDVTNSATITPTYQEGDGSTTSRAFVRQRGTFLVPGSADADARIAFRLDVSGSGTMTAQMGPIVAYPQKAKSFPLQARVESVDDIGNFFYATGTSANGGPDERGWRGPITIGGRNHMIDMDGDHMAVSFNFSPTEPIYYDEYVRGTELSAMTDTTSFPKERVLKWARYELYEILRRKSNLWREEAERARKSAAIYDIKTIKAPTIVGRV